MSSVESASDPHFAQTKTHKSTTPPTVCGGNRMCCVVYAIRVMRSAEKSHARRRRLGR